MTRNNSLLVLMAVLLFGSASWAAPPAIVLSDAALPGHDAALARTLTGTLQKAGYAPRAVTVSQMAAPNALAPTRCALLALPQARALPTVLIPPVRRYLERGGHLLLLGGPAWDMPLVRQRAGRWITAAEDAEAQALLPPARIAFDFGADFPLSSWTRSSNDMTSPTTIERVEVAAVGRTAGALHVIIPDLTSWDTFNSPVLSQSPFGPGQTLTVLSARGGSRTHALALEWDERDGSRWIATIPLTDHWQRYVVPPSAFHAWQVPAERARTGFHPDQAVRFSVGLAHTHTGTLGGRHEYWVAQIGTEAAAGTDQTDTSVALPPLDVITPRYKFFPVTGPVRLQTPAGQGLTRPVVLPATGGTLWAAQPRPDGAGYDKGLPWRWAPLLEARDARSGEWRGNPGALLVHEPGRPYGGGAWATLPDAASVRQAALQPLVLDIARRMREGLFLREGGARTYTVLPGQPVRLGVRALNVSPEDTRHPAVARLTVAGPGGKAVWRRAWPLSLAAGTEGGGEAVWTPPAKWPVGGYTVTTELMENGQVVDRLRHGLSVWMPPAHPDFITVGADGHFHHNDGRLWRACGVNYMPSSGIGVEDATFFEYWLSAQSYDPQVIERDLTHIQKLGLNAVSAFVYHGDETSRNLLDFLRRCRDHHLRVNLGLRPGLPDNWDGTAMRALLAQFRLAENDTVFAYDVAWEPGFGDHEARQKLDPAWRDWVTAHYGSIVNAERAWGASAPRDTPGGAVTNPPDSEIGTETGPHARMVADYRRFLDAWLADTYGRVTRELHQTDPHHAVSFRMSEAGDPTNDGAHGLPYRFQGLAGAVDFLSPEAYGRIGDWTHTRAGWFEIAYARALAPGKPVLWAEVGTSVWDEAAMQDDPERLQFEGLFYDAFFRMARASGSDGLFFWWYPGGYRVGERSDFGLINPDGTDRPATRSVRRNAARFLQSPPPPIPDVWLDFNAQSDPYQAYRHIGDAFWAAVDQGHHPGLRPVFTK